uniref:Uncharacterized protein n=1 Tax=viral metagenome TaxID=1070528 RepID=A0A6M3JJY3_9ZZZZ
MPRRNKFKPGDTVHTIEQLDIFLAQGRWVYMWNRPKHPSFIDSMPLRTVRYFVTQNAFKIALPNKEEE